MTASKSFFVIAYTCLLTILLFPLHSHSHAAVKNSPRTYLKNLQGYRKGDQVNDIKYLKKYLQRFGYLSNHEKSSSSISYDDDDFFDEKLESAIKTYQTNFNLNPTGFLDSETVTLMSKPRCGVPDHDMIRSRMNNNSKFHSHYALVEWSKHTRFAYQKIDDFSTADIKIGFYTGYHGDDGPFVGPGGGAYAHAFAPTYGQIHYNLNQTWVNGVVEGGVDLMTVGLHELGHVLGLAHSTIEAAIMWPYIDANSTKGLDADDAQGIHALYAS
ncbi:hypothetical protein Q3G72_032034 [Acer saccharum]|nr:hypothetical protein Q3G72_032034 [Acer saccharum]